MISAQGGQASGNGGFVEVSGKHYLDFFGQADTLAAQGQAGILLLDPDFITIVDGGTDNFVNSDTTLAFTENATGTSQLDADLINTASTNVLLQAEFDITFNEDINITTDGVGLTAEAKRDITVNSDIATNNGDITLTADVDNTGGGMVWINGATISTGTGDITLHGQGYDGTAQQRRGILLESAAQLLTTDGNVTLTGNGGDGLRNNHGIEIINNSLIRTADGAITLIGTGGMGTETRNRRNINKGILIDTSTLEATGSGRITLDGTGGTGTGGGLSDFRSHGIHIITSRLSTQDGVLQLAGDSFAIGEDNSGIFIENNNQISSTRGNITITGISHAGLENSRGITLIGPDNRITSVSGDITLTGTSNGIGLDTEGIKASASVPDISTDTGHITLVGTATNDDGINITGGGLASNTGNITLIGDGDRANGFYDINSWIGGTSGTLTLRGNMFNIAPVGTGPLIIEPLNASDSIGVGDGATGILQLSDNFLNSLNSSFNQVTIGRTDGTGDIDVQTTAFSNNLLLLGNDITFNGIASFDWQIALDAWALGNITVNPDAEIIALNEDVNFIADRDNNGAGIVLIDGADMSTLDGSINLTGSAVDIRDNTQLMTDSGDITFTTDNLTIAASATLTGSGQLMFNPFNTTTSIGLGDGATGTLHLDNAELSTLQDGFSQITFGRADGTGNMEVRNATLLDNVLLLANNITFDDTFTLTGTNDTLDVRALRDITANIGAGILTNDGDVTLTADMDNTDGGAVLIDGATIRTGAGNIEITGQGRAGRRIGIEISNGGQLITDSGDITFNGIGDNGTANKNYGIYVTDTGTIMTTQSGAIRLDGAGQGSGNNNHGLFIDNHAQLTSNSGAIDLTGLPAANGTGIVLGTSTQLGNTSGDLILNTDTLTIDATATLAGTGQLTFNPLTATTSIGLGNATVGTLQLSRNELATLQDGFSLITFGRADGTGDIVVNYNAFLDSVLLLGNDILLSKAKILGLDDSLTVHALNDIVLAGNVTLASNVTNNNGDITLIADVDGDNAGTVRGSASIVSADLGTLLIQGAGIGVFTDSLVLAGNNVFLNQDLNLINASDSFTIRAFGDITLNTNITTNGGNVSLTARSGANIDNMVQIDGATINTGAGDIKVIGSHRHAHVPRAGVTISNGSQLLTTSGSITIDATARDHDALVITSSAQLSSSSGQIELTGRALGTDTDIVLGSGIFLGSTHGNLTLNTDSISINATATLAGTGQLLFNPLTRKTSIGLGHSTAGTLNLTGNELATFQDGFSLITIGRSDGTGAVDVGDATFSDNVLIHGGDFSLSGDISSTATGDAIVMDMTGNDRRGNFFKVGSDIQTPNGRWLVYAYDPNISVEGSLSGAEHEYDMVYSAVPAFGGSGFIYVRRNSVVPITIPALGISPQPMHSETLKMSTHCEPFTHTLGKEFMDNHEALLFTDVSIFNEKLADWLVWYQHQDSPHSVEQTSLPVTTFTRYQPKCNIWLNDTYNVVQNQGSALN